MSRDWTPKEFDIITKQNGEEYCDILDMVMYVNGSDKGTPMFSDDEKIKIKSLPTLSRIGIDFLSKCISNGVYNSEKGRDILQQLEDYFSSGSDIKDKELLETAKLWYEGQLVPGYYMNGNTDQFVTFIYHKTFKE